MRAQRARRMSAPQTPRRLSTITATDRKTAGTRQPQIVLVGVAVDGTKPVSTSSCHAEIDSRTSPNEAASSRQLRQSRKCDSNSRVSLRPFRDRETPSNPMSVHKRRVCSVRHTNLCLQTSVAASATVSSPYIAATLPCSAAGRAHRQSREMSALQILHHHDLSQLDRQAIDRSPHGQRLPAAPSTTAPANSERASQSRPHSSPRRRAPPPDLCLTLA